MMLRIRTCTDIRAARSRWSLAAVCAPAVMLAAGWICLQPTSCSAQSAEPVPMKVLRYARHLVAQYDTDGDGRLSSEEWSRLPGDPAAADLDGDGYLTVDELAAYMSEYGARRRIRLMPATVETDLRFPSLLRSDEARGDRAAAVDVSLDTAPDEVDEMDEAAAADSRRFAVPASRLPQGLPSWFRERDLNGDGQVTLAEFAPTGSLADIELFRAYDHNGDGVITVAEALAGPRAPARRAQPQRSRDTAPPAPPEVEPAVEDVESDAAADDAD